MILGADLAAMYGGCQSVPMPIAAGLHLGARGASAPRASICDEFSLAYADEQPGAVERLDQRVGQAMVARSFS